MLFSNYTSPIRTRIREIVCGIYARSGRNDTDRLAGEIFCCSSVALFERFILDLRRSLLWLLSIQKNVMGSPWKIPVSLVRGAASYAVHVKSAARRKPCCDEGSKARFALDDWGEKGQHLICIQVPLFQFWRYHFKFCRIRKLSRRTVDGSVITSGKSTHLGWTIFYLSINLNVHVSTMARVGGVIAHYQENTLHDMECSWSTRGKEHYNLG
jgi:hypothetical protein